MKIEILQENLIKATNSVSRIIPPRPQIPILGNILLTADDSGLHLQGGDGEVVVRTIVGAKVLVAGAVCVPSKLFTELVVSLNPGKIEIFVEKGVMTINSDSFKGKINCQSFEEYPAFPQKQPITTLSVDTKIITSSLSKVVFSTAIDSSRPALTGVLFRKTDLGWQLVATDAFRLSLVNLAIETNGFADLIIPSKVLSEVMRLESSETREKLQVIFCDQIIGFKFDTTEIYSTVIAGNYPAFEKIIPSESKYKLSVSKNIFEKAIKTAAIFGRDSSNIVKLKFPVGVESLCVISAAATGEQEQEIEARIIVPVDDELIIAFNYRYLLEYLSSTQAQEIVLEITGPLSPVVFKNPLDLTFLHLIMPVRLQS